MERGRSYRCSDPAPGIFNALRALRQRHSVAHGLCLAAVRHCAGPDSPLVRSPHIKTSLYPDIEAPLSTMRSSYLFTSESVSEGHPDKVADQISDAIVDLFLSKDPEARVACETMTTTNRVVLAGEIRGEGVMDREGNWAPGIREE